MKEIKEKSPDKYLKENKMIDFKVMINWKVALSDLFSKKVSVARCIDKNEVLYRPLFRSFIQFASKKGWIVKVGRGSNITYKSFGDITDDKIREFYKRFRLGCLIRDADVETSEILKELRSTQDFAKSDEKRQAEFEAEKDLGKRVMICYPKYDNNTGLPKDQWAVVEWLKQKGFRISQQVWREL